MKINLDIPNIQSTYIIFKRNNEINIENSIIYSKTFTDSDKNKIQDILLQNTDIVIDVKLGREFKVNEKIFMIQRYIHNELNISYKDIINVEIIYTEKKLDYEELRISHRYPNEGRSTIDFQATILDTFVECEIKKENIINNDIKIYIMVMISNNPDEKKSIGELVNRYLFIENIESQRNQIEQNHIPPVYSSLYPPVYPTPQVYSSSRNMFNTFSNILNRPNRPNILYSNLSNHSVSRMSNITESNITESKNLEVFSSNDILSSNNSLYQIPSYIENDSTFLPYYSYLTSSHIVNINNLENNSGNNIGPITDYERKIQELETQRENELNEIRSTFSNNREILEDDLDNEMYIINNDLQIQPLNLLGNMVNLLLYVNNINENNDINFENLMEPVRVTVSQDNMNIFLTSFKYKIGNNEEQIKIKDQDQCTICLSDYENDEDVSYLNTCNHLFHKTCINKWLLEFNHKCPICRKSSDPVKNDNYIPP